jgi:redox-sensitive bicupin YhaK (pirin superfamily)
MTERSIRKIVQASVSRHGAGLTTRDATPEVLGADMDPFIVVSLYDMAGPTFPPHPHAGFAVATYMLPESPLGFINQDSIGNVNAIPPGALHVTVAGSGVLHEEQPQGSGSIARGFQIWIDLKNGERGVAPHALHLPASDVPVARRHGATVRAVLGASNGIESPLVLPTRLRLIDVALEPGAGFTQELDSGENAFVLMIGGQASTHGRDARAGELASTVPDGDRLTLIAGANGARFTLFAGLPLRQRRAQRGPMVAGDAAELQGFMSAYVAGRFGHLKPFAEQALDR